MKYPKIRYPKMSYSLLAAVVLLVGCSSTPEPAPVPVEAVEAPAWVDVQAVATEITAFVLSGDVASAESLLAPVEQQQDYEAIYTVIYDRAQALAREGDYESCIRVNRFLVKAWPNEQSAQEALVYSLWLSRAQSGRPHDAATVKEIQTVAARLRAGGESVPVWVDIALTQAAIDIGDLEAARTAMTRFNERWDREPPALRAYAAELENYIETHSVAN